MTIAVTPLAAGSSQPVSTFTMSLIQYWVGTDGAGRPLAAGDLVMLEVRKPLPVLAGPSGWVQATDRIFYKIIGPPEGEQPPVFCASGAADWEICGVAVAGDQITPLDDSGSAVEWRTTPTPAASREEQETGC